MQKISAANKKQLATLNAELKVLQEKLVEANKREGKDVYIDVKLQKKQARFERIKRKNAEDTAVGHFYMEIDITAKQVPVFIPLSMASGKKVAGFMYQIEGTAEGSIATAAVRVRGKGVSQVTLGTLVYAKVPAGTTASFEIRATIRGGFGKKYKIVIARLNYKLNLTDARYQQYLKELHSDEVKFSN